MPTSASLWDRATALQRRVLLPRSHASPAGRSRRSYRAEHNLRSASTTQKAIDALVHQEIVAKDGGFVRISEPFYAEWIQRNARR